MKRKRQNSLETPTSSKDASWEECLEDVFQEEVITAFPNITEFKEFAQSKKGLCLDGHTVQLIVKVYEGSEKEQKLRMLLKWTENKEEKATVGKIRYLLRKYLREQSPTDYIVLGNGMFGVYKNRVLCKQGGHVFLGEEISEVTGSYLCAIKLQPNNDVNLREAKILSKLRSHVNVVSILHAGILRSDPFDYIFIAMDLSWTDTVRKMLEDSDRLRIPFNEFLLMNLVKQILRALDFIHSNNIIHRDLKPENVLLSRDWSQSKVTNFGFSKTITDGHSTRQTSEKIGTDGYRAGETYDTTARISLKSDIFSAGVTIAEILANGKHPFGENPYLWSNNIINDTDPNLCHLCVSNKDQVIASIKRMLVVNPEKRPTAEEVLNEVEQFQTLSQPKNQQTAATSSMAKLQCLAAEEVLNEVQQCQTLSQPKNQQTAADQSSATSSMTHTADQSQAASSLTQLQRPTAEEIQNEVQQFQALSQQKNQQTTADQSSAASSMSQSQHLTADEVLQFQASSQPKNQQTYADQSPAASSMTQLQRPTAEEVQQFPALSQPKNQQTTAYQSTASAQMAELSIKEKANAIIMVDWSEKRIYSFKAKEWSPMQKCDIGSHIRTPIVSGIYMYILENQKVYQLEYSDLTAKWKEMSSMSEDHGENPSAGMLNCLIYVCGGSGIVDASKSVERYDAAQDRWEPICDMNIARAYSCVVATKGSIYVCGGSGLSDASKSVERYDPALDQWELILNMKIERAYSCVFATKDQIYYVGGRDTLEHLSVEKSNKWEVVESSPIINEASIAVAENRIYIADHEGVRCYDIQNNSWSKMETKEWYFAKGWLVKILAVNEELYVIGRISESSSNTAIYHLEPKNGQMTLIEKFNSKKMKLLILSNWLK